MKKKYMIYYTMKYIVTYGDKMNEDIKELYEIDKELDESKMKRDDYITALEKIYERFEGYYGIKTEMVEWLLNEKGETKFKTDNQIKRFYLNLIERIYNMLIKKEYNRIYPEDKKEWYKRGQRDKVMHIIKLIEESK